jgi:hypothetical protein
LQRVAPLLPQTSRVSVVMSAPLPALELGLTPWDFSSLTAHSLATQAAYAESLGYRTFRLPENHFNPYAIPDPLMLLAAVAASTREIKLATTSYLLPLRNPLLAAEQVAVLDRLSEGGVHQGIVLRRRTPASLDLNQLRAQLVGRTTPPLLLAIDHPQDPHNLGACLRVADGAGVDAV